MSACTCGCGCADGTGCCEPLIPVPPVPDCVVQFDYSRWSLIYPVFATTGHYPVTAAQAQELFYDATLYLDNSCDSPVCDASIGGERERLLYMMTAHLAQLGQIWSMSFGTPGRVVNKAVGPVSVGYGGLEGLPGSAAWFAQTPFGLSFWQATLKYRSFRYRVPYVPYNFPSWRGYR